MKMVSNPNMKFHDKKSIGYQIKGLAKKSGNGLVSK
jgi:hypothetical protein